MLSVAQERPVSLQEVASRLGVSLRTVRRWARGSGGRRLETFRAGRIVRTSFEAVERFQLGASAATDLSDELEQRRIEAALEERHGIISEEQEVGGQR